MKMAGRSEKMYKDSPKMERDDDTGKMEVKKPSKADAIDAGVDHMNINVRHPAERREMKHKHMTEHMAMHHKHEMEHGAHDEKGGSKMAMHERHEKEMKDMHGRHESEHKSMHDRHEKEMGEGKKDMKSGSMK